MDPITVPSIDPLSTVTPTEPEQEQSQQPQQPPQQQAQVKLTEIPVKDDNTALNLMVGFLDTAQKRGAFSIDESAKIWECIQRFIQSQQPPANP